jgi:hypothetical protein
VLDGLQVALTGQGRLADTPGGVGGDVAVIDADAHPRRTARAIFHQIIYGRVSNVALMPELDELVRAKVHTPRLLGRAAVAACLGSAQAGSCGTRPRRVSRQEAIHLYDQ